MIKKILGITVLLFLCLQLIAPTSVMAQTNEELLTRICELQTIIAQLLNKPAPPCASEGGAVISGVSGPNFLAKNQVGTWTVYVTAPAGSQLRYNVDWGVPGATAELFSKGASGPVNVGQEMTFSQSYATEGKYNVTFWVANDSAKGSPKSKTTITVNVGSSRASTGSVTIGSAKLYLTYSNGQENLKAEYSLKVNTGRDAACVTDNFYPVLSNGKNNQGPTSVSSGPVRAATPAKCFTGHGDTYVGFIIPPYSSMEFKVDATYNPLQMFAGSYYGIISSLYIRNLDQMFKSNGMGTNTVVIVGEKSPYISSISADTGKITFKGVRVNYEGTNPDRLMVANNSYPISKINTGEYRVNIPTNLTGMMMVYLQSSKGNSNNVWVDVPAPVNYVINISTVPSNPTGNLTLAWGDTAPGSHFYRVLATWTEGGSAKQAYIGKTAVGVKHLNWPVGRVVNVDGQPTGQLVSGINYGLKVCRNDTAECGSIGNTFTVPAQPVSNESTISLNDIGLEVWRPMGSKIPLTWTDSSNQSPKYNLFLRSATGQWPIAWGVTPTVTNGNKSYEWTVGTYVVGTTPPPLGEAHFYYITVCNDYASKCAYTGRFRINAGTTTTSVFNQNQMANTLQAISNLIPSIRSAFGL